MSSVDFEPLTVQEPLREEPAGVFRVGRSRVLLELVIQAFQGGATPEAIVQSYDTLNLADVYAVVSHYLANPAPFEEYLRERDAAAARGRRGGCRRRGGVGFCLPGTRRWAAQAAGDPRPSCSAVRRCRLAAGSRGK